jgi:hypothetical protein
MAKWYDYFYLYRKDDFEEETMENADPGLAVVQGIRPEPIESFTGIIAAIEGITSEMPIRPDNTGLDEWLASCISLLPDYLAYIDIAIRNADKQNMDDGETTYSDPEVLPALPDLPDLPAILLGALVTAYGAPGGLLYVAAKVLLPIAVKTVGKRFFPNEQQDMLKIMKELRDILKLGLLIEDKPILNELTEETANLASSDSILEIGNNAVYFRSKVVRT